MTIYSTDVRQMICSIIGFEAELSLMPLDILVHRCGTDDKRMDSVIIGMESELSLMPLDILVHRCGTDVGRMSDGVQ